jgi:hypothetical protein
MVSIKNVLGGLLFVVIGVGVAGYGAYTGYVQVNDVNSAIETTEGTIQSSDVEQATETEEGETEVEFYPRISYDYAANDRTLTGERIYSTLDREQEPGELVGKEFDNRNRARNVAGRFSPGETVTVYYFPDDPSRSFLIKPTVDWLFVGGAGLFGLVFSLGGVAAMFSNE